ncbi:MAG: ROK family transcriptional regulator [Pseudobdellovibrionaceae bacterium]|nr:ROK family transcriptional regulator [Pseudobdellovibrionaceae bacterium]
MDIVSGDKPDMETLDSAHMRVLNSSTLLKMIWRDREISRADISQRTGMSRSTVSTIVADLIRRGLVTETGTGHSNGGRRPVILSFNEDAYSILGIDLQVDEVRVAITNLRAGIRHWWQQPCPVRDDPDACLDMLFALIQKAKTQCADDGKPLIGIGLGLPGPVHPDKTVNAMSEDLFPKWQGRLLQNILRDKIQLPLALEKDANLGALSEHWWKNPQGPGNLAYINAQKHAGLVFEGRMHRGSHGLAGDLGPLLTKSGPVADDRALVQLLSNLLAVLDLDTVVLDQSLLDRSEPRLSDVRHEVLGALRGLGQRMPRIDFGSMGDRQVALGASTQILNHALEDFTLFPTTPSMSYAWSWSREPTVTP